MIKNNLTKHEIDGINLYLEEVVKIPMIEAVYLISFVSSKQGRDRIWLMTLYNNSLAYNEKITGEKIHRDITKDSDKLVSCNHRYNCLFAKRRLSFITEDTANYNLGMMSNQQLMAERSLVSGTILFDRFGDFEANRQKASEVLEPFEDSCQIENISAIKPVKAPSLAYLKKKDI